METRQNLDERPSEADLVAAADAEIESGLYVDAAEIEAWVESIGTDHELPPPPTRKR